MSDPVTNTEIEDVLTSIRRLVSENRPLSEGEDTEAPVATTAFDISPASKDLSEVASAPVEAPLALVLTPALRVADDPVEEADDISSEDSGGQDEPVESLDAGEDCEAAFDEAPLPVDETDVAEHYDEAILSGETSVDLQEEELEAASEPAPVKDGVTGEVSSWDDGAATTPFDAASDAAPEETVDVEQPFDFKQVLEARIHQFRDATSTEDVTNAAEDHDTPNMADAITDELRGRMPEDLAEAIDVSGEEVFSEAMDDAAEIDEAMLREMVADIVRQELQGALGERITRNVRKLVRREIHRALAAHDLG